MVPFPGSERTLALFLEGMGFKVFRVDGTFMVRAPQELWRRVFNEIDPLSREVIVPAELADLVTRVVLLRPRSEANPD